ncbi:OB-fold domain-containing protein [Patescibacteria group bacterium AH-259-L07]|nr:OB-fold domain-containing protein [Patescibacteria group bacterium AH-259-L07]
MEKKRTKVVLTPDESIQLVKELFKQNVPENSWVRPNPRSITHYHTYGNLTPFFKGLTQAKLFGTRCRSCTTGIWLPPRAHCPDCWKEMEWVEVNTEGARVYTHSMTQYPGAGFKGSVPCPLISVEIPGVCTKFMSYLSEFRDGEPYINMPVRPVFRTKNPTYTILDISWVVIA